MAVMPSLLTLPVKDLVSYVGIDYALHHNLYHVQLFSMHNSNSILFVNLLSKTNTCQKIVFLVRGNYSSEINNDSTKAWLYFTQISCIQTHSYAIACELVHRMYCYAVEFTIYSKQFTWNVVATSVPWCSYSLGDTRAQRVLGP